MNSALNLHHPPPPSPPLSTTLRRHQNAPNHPQFHVPVTDLSLRRIATTTPSQVISNHRRKKLYSLKNDTISVYTGAMADESKKTEVQSGSTAANPAALKAEDKTQSESEKSKKAIPPPPEKPLPGDCCGSGCVSCIWDLYYEELEEYNKLYKAK